MIDVKDDRNPDRGGNLGRSEDASRESATDIIGQCISSRAATHESPIPIRVAVSSPLSFPLLCSVGGLSTFRFEFPFHSPDLFSLLDQYRKFPTETTGDSGSQRVVCTFMYGPVTVDRRPASTQ